MAAAQKEREKCKRYRLRVNVVRVHVYLRINVVRVHVYVGLNRRIIYEVILTHLGVLQRGKTAR